MSCSVCASPLEFEDPVILDVQVMVRRYGSFDELYGGRSWFRSGNARRGSCVSHVGYDDRNLFEVLDRLVISKSLDRITEFTELITY